jgi:hypothetical protein
MTYYLNLFTPDTWEAFRKHGSKVSGFRQRQEAYASEHVNPGDIFLCYLVLLSRWCGALEITSGAFHDSSPIFSDPDPFVVRFQVKPVVELDPERSLPIFEDEIWNHLIETQGIGKGAKGWAKYYRGSLRRMADGDGDHLLTLLRKQAEAQVAYPLTERDKRQLARKRTVKTLSGEVEVVVPVPEDDEEEGLGALIQGKGGIQASATVISEPEVEVRQSIQIQAKVAEIGAKMGFRIWVPASDRNKVLQQVAADHRGSFLDVLPLNYDDTTLDTIKQIDVLWLKGRAMARAFEVEHTTAIYSGLLRMADLLALQPNMQIKLHIVAPEERWEKVRREIKRPVFSLLDHGPLYERCTYLSYDDVQSIADMKFLNHMSDSVLDEYVEQA